MSVKTITKTIEEEIAEKCDSCNKTLGVIEEGRPFMPLRHGFGYGTVFDGSYVEAEICDECLHSMLMAYVPNARWHRSEW